MCLGLSLCVLFFRWVKKNWFLRKDIVKSISTRPESTMVAMVSHRARVGPKRKDHEVIESTIKTCLFIKQLIERLCESVLVYWMDIEFESTKLFYFNPNYYPIKFILM